jgi:hypothetical protein
MRAQASGMFVFWSRRGRDVASLARDEMSALHLAKASNPKPFAVIASPPYAKCILSRRYIHANEFRSRLLLSCVHQSRDKSDLSAWVIFGAFSEFKSELHFGAFGIMRAMIEINCHEFSLTFAAVGWKMTENGEGCGMSPHLVCILLCGIGFITLLLNGLTKAKKYS